MSTSRAMAVFSLVFACGDGAGIRDGAPAAPSDVRALPGNQFVRVYWQDNSPDETGFAIFRASAADGAFETVAEVGADVTEWDDLDVSPKGTYRYAVAATGAGADSERVEMTGPLVSPLPGSLVDCEVASPSAEDQDGDGVPDANELQGWTVVLTDGLGATSERAVTSNPLVGDSDNDGLCDREERQSVTDPSEPDTDGDGLTDTAELRTWGSSPTDVDSDDDSRGNAALFDGNELDVHATSPIIADTDGDGIDDYVEIIERGEPFDPLVANTPVIELDFVGETDITLDVAYTDSKQEAESRQVSLGREASSSESSTRSSTHEAWAEAGVSATVEASASFPAGASVSASTTVSASAGYSYTSSRSVTRSSSQTSREAYQWGVDTSRQSGREVTDGALAVGFVARNRGDVSFTLSDLTVTALQRDIADPSRFRAISTLTFDDSGLTDGLALGPDGETGTLRGSAVVPADRALGLLANPEGLFFEVATFELTDEEGRNFEFLREVTNAQTGQVIVDFGNGIVVERRVATNVQRENGRIQGIRMGDVLGRALDLQYRTEVPDDGGPSRLVAVTPPGGAEVAVDAAGSRFWAVITSAGIELDEDTAFDDIRLRAGESVTLFYVKDRDGDGLFAHEEYRFGTSEDTADGDSDGLTDREETVEGWQVAAFVPPYPRPVFSDPTAADSDEDGATDFEEREAQTNPFNPDTDGDGFCDGDGMGGELGCSGVPDTDPLDPLDFPVTAIASFPFDGNGDDTIGGATISSVGGGCVLSQLFGADRDGFADAALDVEVNQLCSGDPNDHAGLMSNRSYDFDDGFSIMFWLRHEIAYTDEPWFLVGVEGVFSLRLAVDNSGPTDHVQVEYLEGETPIFGDAVARPAGTWDHYTLTVDGTTARLYRNGVEVGSGTRSVGAVTAPVLLLNARADDDPRWAFGRNGRGRFDDLVLYDEALSASAVQQVFNTL